MAVNITPIYSASATKFIGDAEATADADTTATFAHGLGVAPMSVQITALQAEFYISEWRVTTIDATNVVLTKGTGVGSGVAGSQVRMECSAPHSIV